MVGLGLAMTQFYGLAIQRGDILRMESGSHTLRPSLNLIARFEDGSEQLRAMGLAENVLTDG